MRGEPTITILETLAIPVADLVPYPANPRRGDVDLIRESVRMHGQYRALVVNRRSMQVLAGNHLLQALKAEGFTEALCHLVDVDDEEAARIVLVDNRASDRASYDDEMLAELLQSLPDLAGTGYDDQALNELLAQTAPKGGLTDPDDVPEPPAAPFTKPGDLWLLGKHRLLCGDSTKAEDVGRLMAGAKGDMLWTDPPYGVGYVGKTKDALTIRNDGTEGLDVLLGAALSSCGHALEGGAPFYIAHPPGALSLTFGNAILAASWRLHQTLIWAKDSMVLGHADYHYKHEPIYYGWTAGGEGRPGRGGQAGSKWYGDQSATSVLEVPRPQRSAEHPTSKPVELVAIALRNSSRPGEIVLDPFCGSGSTIVAAHREGRIAYGLEIDPIYCDVICRRYQEFTGERPVLEATGEARDFTV